MEHEHEQERQHYKRYKGLQKEFNLWNISQIEDFSPETTLEDPLKRYYHLLGKKSLTSLPNPERKKLRIVTPQAVKTLKHGSNFDIKKYWKQLPSQLVNENIMRFLDLKDIVMFIYTCRYFKEALDQGSMWKVLQGRDFTALGLRMLGDDTKDRFSEKLYYKYLYLSKVSGIPYHTGYFKAYGSTDVVELSEFIVDFLCPKREAIKNYVGEILARNQCKTCDLKLSWLKKTNEICLWNGNSSLEFRKPEKEDEEVETVNEFYPCFIKRYSMINEDEEIVKIFFLEDKYLVVKLQKKEEETRIFRILDLEAELRSIAKGLEPAIPIDYSFMMARTDDDMKTTEFGVDFVLDQENDCEIQVKLLLGDRAVFYTENSAKPTLIFWDLKEKKKIDFISPELQKPLNSIIVSKKSEVTAEKIEFFIIDEDMNVYCASLSQTNRFHLNQTIILPTPPEEKEEEIEIEMSQEDIKKLKELEAKYHLNLGKRTRNQYIKGPPTGRFPTYLSPHDSPYSFTKPLGLLNEKTRRYYHEIWNKTNEEWLIVHVKNSFHFINLDKGKIQDFSSGKDISDLDCGNWTVYEDNLLITSSERIFYFKIDFEDHKINFRFLREIKNLYIEDVGIQWIVIDPCFTVIIFTHPSQLGFTTKATIIVTSTQEFLYNQDSAFNLISYKIQAEQFFSAAYKLESEDRDLDIKFENSKVLVKTSRASFYFDMNLSVEPYHKVYYGWMSKKSIHIIEGFYSVVTKVEPAVAVVKEEVKPAKPKMVNNMKLKGNPNTINSKEKNNGWNKSGKSQAKRDEDKEYKVLKAKGDKYQKNIRQGQRSDKVN